MVSAAADQKLNWSVAELEARVVRYGDLRPCFNAFIDCRTPGSEAKENFTIIGPGVSENPHQYVHIAEPHGFNIGGARQPPGCVNSQHSHDTAEVFVVHTGQWRFDLGEHGEGAQVHLAPGDVISIPTNMFRGFTATAAAEDGTPGFLWAVLGEDNPGRVTWAPDVFDLAKKFGLVLLENGSLVDTAGGEVVPEDVAPMPPTSPQQAAALTLPTAQEAADFVWRDDRTDGSYATAIIGEAGPIDWAHGFDLDRIDIAAGDRLDMLPPEQPEVVFVHEGSLRVRWPDGDILLGAGDTMSIPVGLDRQFESDTGCVAYVALR